MTTRVAPSWLQACARPRAGKLTQLTALAESAFDDSESPAADSADLSRNRKLPTKTQTNKCCLSELQRKLREMSEEQQVELTIK